MTAYIPVPRDLSTVKTKVAMGLTKRQLVCFGSGAVVGVPLFFVLKGFNTTLAMFVMIAVMMPFFLLAMYEKDRMKFEVIVRHYYNSRFKRPKVRPYKTNNNYTRLIKAIEAQKEVDKIVREAQERIYKKQ